jgi:uncharacterized caspase-like protein
MQAPARPFESCTSCASLRDLESSAGGFEGKLTVIDHSKHFQIGRFGLPGRYYVINTLVAVICFTFAMMAAAQQQAMAGGRIALLLGEENYQHFQASPITVNQVKELGEALRKQGFDVNVAANSTNAGARAALSDFSRKAETADYALIVLAGHFATYRRNTFFLPSNARVRRATDLFSRGLSTANIADIAHRAKAGALLMLMTVADIPSTVAGVSARPDFANEPPKNIVAVYSTSSKVPVSGVGNVSRQAMKDLIDAAREQPMMLAALVSSASAGGAGLIFGDLKDVNLSQDATAPAEQAPAAKEPEKVQATSDEELKARELAEKRLSAAQERTRIAEQQAREAEELARRKLAEARAATAKAAEEKAAAEERTKTAAATTRQEPAQQSARPETTSPSTTELQSLQVVEALLGREQRKTIQRLLKDMGLYDGPIDAIFGERTRVAIRAFQKQNDAAETGYMTPEQFQKLIAKQ